MKRYTVLKEAFLDGQPGMIDKLSELKKQVTGRVIRQPEQIRLRAYEVALQTQRNSEPPIGRIETDFYRGSKQMGKEYEKDGGYWDSNVEMTARAFACYVKDKLPYRSDYLVGHAESAISMVLSKNSQAEVVKAYPQGEERQAINAVFDEIIADLKLQHILTHAEVTLPLRIPDAQKKPGAQLSMFESERPSLMGKLASIKLHEKTADAPKVPAKKKEEMEK